MSLGIMECFVLTLLPILGHNDLKIMQLGYCPSLTRKNFSKNSIVYVVKNAIKKSQSLEVSDLSSPGTSRPWLVPGIGKVSSLNPNPSFNHRANLPFKNL